ncbi:MAG TPA: hypothetical protein PKY19_03650 [Oscillospiraceae bacterium]|nr:hypothetical protein [Oscillospiraceae bacterium]
MFDVIAALVLTFFAALGMVKTAAWLMDLACERRLPCTALYVMDLIPGSASCLEDEVRSILADDEKYPRTVLLCDCGADLESRAIAEMLMRRFSSVLLCDKKDLPDVMTACLQHAGKEL